MKIKVLHIKRVKKNNINNEINKQDRQDQSRDQSKTMTVHARSNLTLYDR